MKNKIICLLLAIIMVFGVFAFTACGGKTPDPDPDPDPTPGPDGGDEEDAWWEDITYDETNLRFKMTKSSNMQELSSGCERYLAGSTSDGEDIDDLVAERNEAALFNTKVTITYDYYDDSSDYAWSKCITQIFNEVQSNSSTTPDMYCNFLTDMLSTSLLGSFANLYSRERGTGDLKGVNYLDIDLSETDEDGAFGGAGYMSELMSSLTLSSEKIYVIASDYFIDLIRAFFVVPVNRQMYDGIAERMDDLQDYNGDGVKDINDFFEEIWAMKWTYTRLAEYSAAVYNNDSGQTTANLGDTVGFALSSESGLSAAGMVYTSSVTVIYKEFDNEKGDYNYYYPDSGAELTSLTDALNTLFSSKGVISVSADKTEYNQYGGSSLQAIRYRFSQNKVLFGGVVLVGSLEYDDYQNMKGYGDGGFGVVPVPLFRTTNPTTGEAEKYQTQIHVVGRAGGIAHSTRKFAQCTAFIQYQSTHSADVLNQYYNYNLVEGTAGGLEGNADMLKYIRSNVRTCFDKVFEDSIGFFYETVDPEAVNKRWHALISSNRYKMTDMAQQYASLAPAKQVHLEKLEKEYERLPN